MGSPKPFEHWPSRTDAVVGLRKQGLSTQEIANRIGIPTENVQSLEYGARHRSAPRRPRPDARTVVFPLEVLERAKPHAERRDISANELIRRLIDIALDDNLVDGILDDGECS